MTILLQPAEVKGELKIYSCPKTIIKHVEWALNDLFKMELNYVWNPQPIAPLAMSSEIKWIGPVGFGSRIVSLLGKWPKMRLEVFQNNYKEFPAERYALSPNLGIFRAEINSLGETIITENRLKAALERCRIENDPFEVELAFLLGTPWEEDLEPFRKSMGQNNLKWINKTG